MKTDIKLRPLMPGEDKNFSGFSVLYLRNDNVSCKPRIYKLVSLRKLAPSYNLVNAGHSMDFGPDISVCKTPVFDGKC